MDKPKQKHAANMTPLMTALHHQRYERARERLRAGSRAEIMTVSSRGSALHYAVNTPRTPVDIVRKLAAVPGLIDSEDAQGNTPLHNAACGGIHFVDVLLEHGADCNLQNCEGDTPLHFLVYTSTRTNVQHTLDDTSDVPQAFDQTSDLPHKSDAPENNDTVPGGATSAVLTASYDARLAVARSILSHSTDCRRLLDACDSNGDTALHLAVEYNRQMVPLLLANGADRDLQNHAGHTPLYKALDVYAQWSEWHPEGDRPERVTDARDFKDMIDSLITQANIEMVDYQHGIPPLQVAIYGRFSTETILSLCTPVTMHWHLKPPLYFAVLQGSWSLVPLLMSKGADPREGYRYYEDGSGAPDLPLLEMFSRPVKPPLWVFKHLITPEHMDAGGVGKTALEYALRLGMWEVADLLLRFGYRMRHTTLTMLSALQVRRQMPQNPRPGDFTALNVPRELVVFLQMDRSPVEIPTMDEHNQ